MDILQRIDRINYYQTRPYFGWDCCENCQFWRLFEAHGRGIVDDRVIRGWYDTYKYVHFCNNDNSLYYNEKPQDYMWCPDCKLPLR
jgi:hypothetical protein